MQVCKNLSLKTQTIILLSAIAGWMNRKQQQVIDYLLEENRILKQQFDATGKKLDLTNAQRRSLAKKGKKLGWATLQEYANLVTPSTLMGLAPQVHCRQIHGEAACSN